MKVDQYRDEIDQRRYFVQELVQWRQREVDAMYEHLLADFQAALNTKPDDNSAAEAAVGYSLT